MRKFRAMHSYLRSGSGSVSGNVLQRMSRHTCLYRLGFFCAQLGLVTDRPAEDIKREDEFVLPSKVESSP